MSNQTLHASDTLIHQTLDNYRVVERLGGGAMASVYRAVNVTSDQAVALKVLSPGADDVLRERFRVEARTVSVLEHPNIVRTLGVGQSPQGFPYIAMELVAGDSLATLLERQNQLSVVDSCLLLEPVARALAYAHSHHVIHRDVKPSNILLRHVPPDAPRAIHLSALPTPVIPLLSDFGIARALDAPELTTAGRTIGTPAYMSPEQCAGTRNLDGRADIYSLATVLYRCLVGRPPFMGATTQILHAHVYEALTIPDNVAQALPPVILTILQRALQKNPDDRYADMGLFANDLSTIIQHMIAPGSRPEEGTVTLPMLAALQPEQEKKTAHVLIPSVSEYGARPQPRAGRPEMDNAPFSPWNINRPTQPAPAVKSNPTRAASAVRRQRAQPNWLYLGIGTLLSLSLILFALTAFASLLPEFQFWNPSGGTPVAEVTDAVATPAEMVPNVPLTTTAVAAQTPQQVAEATEIAAIPDVALPDSMGITEPGAGLSATGTITTSPVITYVYNADETATIWTEEVLYLRGALSWRETRRRALDAFSAIIQQEANVTVGQILELSPVEQANLIVSSLLNQSGAAFWTDLQDAVTPADVEQVFFDAYVGIANQENKAKRPVSALAYLDAALILRPAEYVTRLRAATARYANPVDTTGSVAAEELSGLYQTYAGQFAADQSFCLAADFLATAEAIPGESQASEQLLSYQQQCGTIQPTVVLTTPVPPPTEQSGSIVYSTVESGRYRIYRVALDSEPGTQNLLVENGAQPGVSRDKRYMAFFSKRSDSEGLSLYDFASPGNPDSIFPRLSDFIEDGRGSAPSWSPNGAGLVFSSTRESDRRTRLYANNPPSRGNGQFLGFGEDPAWGSSGGQSLIVYQGTDNTGNSPGLWLAMDNGVQLRQLTFNGNDRRPVWSPDGQYIVFMRKISDADWDLFRVRVADGDEIRLTNNPNQDGLPTISPDGQWVAFASDRTGWGIWQVSINGGTEQQLTPIQGSFASWLEHAIQWVK